MNFKLINITFILMAITSQLLAQDLASRATKLFIGRSHTFMTIKSYDEVAERVEFLRGRSQNVSVLSDWDDTLNQTPGAWWQKNHNGSWFCPHTKRFRLEHEVDDQLRHPETIQIIDRIRSQDVPFMVTTARPPIIDVTLQELAKNKGLHANLMDARKTDNPDLIDYDEIHRGVYAILSQMPQDELLELTRSKINTMSSMSGVNISGQDIAIKSHIIVDDGHSLYSYHDGFAFIGHKKGPALLMILPHLNLPKGHLVIVDDSANALGSYLNEDVIDSFERSDYTLHLLHYPVPTI
ncbi:MAG: hypothetical protein KF798_06390 [Candidatus Paracaedibacteraceae bacterium]|nr:hypothetical protein [Candidatus Paracaedibacteraceae bacterium]